MAYFETHPETQLTPAEYETSTPVACSGCGRVWDRDDDFETLYKEIARNVYCAFPNHDQRRSCASIVTERIMRRAIADQITELLTEAQTIIAREEGIHDDYVDCPDHPSEIIDDFLERLKLFGAGQDSSWRPSGIQLPLPIPVSRKVA